MIAQDRTIVQRRASLTRRVQELKQTIATFEQTSGSPLLGSALERHVSLMLSGILFSRSQIRAMEQEREQTGNG